MGAYSPDMKYGITLGSDKKAAYLMLAEFLKGYKATKTELLSIFNNEKDRKTAEQLFDLWNKTQNSDGSEEYIDGGELESIGFQVLSYADNNETDDDSVTNLSDIEVQQLYESKGVSGSSSVLFEMVRYLATKDIASAVESGEFNVDGEKKSFRVVKLQDIDATGKTYKLTESSGFLDNIFTQGDKSKEVYIANFSGKNPELKTLASRIYANFLENESFKQEIIQAPNGAYGTVIRVTAQNQKFDKDKKLALDILLGNNAPSESVSLDNAFDTNADGIKKEFTIIPVEIEDIIKNNDYSRKDLIRALEVISEITNEQIDEMLDTQEAQSEYKEILIKRRDFCKELFSAIKEEKKSKSLSEQFESAKISVIEKLIPLISDIGDINLYERAIRGIPDVPKKEYLAELLKKRKKELTASDIIPEVSQIDGENFNKRLEQLGFKIAESEDNNKKCLGLSGDGIEKYKEKYPQLGISQLINLDRDYLLKAVNIRAKAGIDVLKDEDTFIKFLITEKNFTNLEGEPKAYDYNMYMSILAALDVSLRDKNYHGIKMYKDDHSYKYFHEMYSANSDIGMQVIRELSDKYGLEGLSQFLNKASIPADISVYRGQELSMMENVQLPNGSNLALRMQEALKQLPDETEINKVIDEFNQLGTISMNQPKFVSTSINKDVAQDFARRKEGILMDIKIPAGSKAACLDALVPNKYRKCEEEILVQRGSDYIITGLRFDNENKVWIVDCTLETK